MSNDHMTTGDHIEEQLSGYIDGELTQQQRQRVELHCVECASCSERLAELRSLRDRIGKAGLSVTGEDQWRETMSNSSVRTSRSLGWLIFIAGLLMAAGAALIAFVTENDLSTWENIMIFAIYGGLALLFFSVLRQRLIERKSDKYKDVEI
jgi:hypothetical protein